MSNTAVITFGRMNPITVGHEKLVNLVKQIASDIDATALVYLSHSHDNKRNPINYTIKYGLCSTAFGSCVKFSNAHNIIEVLKELDGKYDKIIFVGDAERSSEFNKTLNKYNGIEYTFDSITTVSAGSRDTNDFVDAISATKMRKYAAVNDYNSFKAGLVTNLKPYARLVQHLVRKGKDYE